MEYIMVFVLALIQNIEVGAGGHGNGYMTRVIMWGTFGIHVDVTPDRNTKMESFYQKATKGIGQELKTKNNGRMDYPDEEMPRDPAFPQIWHNNRIGGKNEN